MRALNKRELELLSKHLGYAYKEEGIMIDPKEMKCENVYAKVPIEVDVYPYDGPIEDEVVIKAGGIENLAQKYFRDLPNPDFGRSPNDEPKDGDEPIYWNTELEKLSWGSLNQYVSEDYFHRFRNEMGEQLSFFQGIKNDWALVLNHEQVGLYSRTGTTYFTSQDSQWQEALFSVMVKFLYHEETERTKKLTEVVDND